MLAAQLLVARRLKGPVGIENHSSAQTAGVSDQHDPSQPSVGKNKKSQPRKSVLNTGLIKSV